MLMLRGGDYPQRLTPPNCTAGSPSYIMDYPGESATFTTASNGIQAENTSYLDDRSVEGYPIKPFLWQNGLCHSSLSDNS